MDSPLHGLHLSSNARNSQSWRLQNGLPVQLVPSYALVIHSHEQTFWWGESFEIGNARYRIGDRRAGENWGKVAHDHLADRANELG